jgi:hypothetical protein
MRLQIICLPHHRQLRSADVFNSWNPTELLHARNHDPRMLILDQPSVSFFDPIRRFRRERRINRTNLLSHLGLDRKHTVVLWQGVRTYRRIPSFELNPKNRLYVPTNNLNGNATQGGDAVLWWCCPSAIQIGSCSFDVIFWLLWFIKSSFMPSPNSSHSAQNTRGLNQRIDLRYVKRFQINAIPDIISLHMIRSCSWWTDDFFRSLPFGSQKWCRQSFDPRGAKQDCSWYENIVLLYLFPARLKKLGSASRLWLCSICLPPLQSWTARTIWSSEDFADFPYMWLIRSKRALGHVALLNVFSTHGWTGPG